MKVQKSRYESKYTLVNRTITFHKGDKDLPTIIFTLPACPDIHTIHGYGLPPEEQKWERFPMPERLEKLQKENNPDTGKEWSLEEFIPFLERHRKEYKEEIRYIRTEWERRISGFWLFINGKPTYIDGWHYFYMNWWKMNTETGTPFPEYRSRDRKFFLGCRGCYQDPDIFGVNWPKPRREGATSRVGCMNYECISRMYQTIWQKGEYVGLMKDGNHGGIQSKEADAAQMVIVDHMVPAWRAMPIFFQPIFRGKTNPKSMMEFKNPGAAITKGSIRSERALSLDSKIDFKSSELLSYDGTKLQFYHGDEVGKTELVDIYARWNVIKKCLSTGNTANIIGFGINTSTVEEMEGGGENFKRLCDQSFYNQRENGRTVTGLVTLFIPANDGLEGYVDEFGNANLVAASKQIESTRDAYRKAGEYDAYAKDIREAPMSYVECWESSPKGNNFNSIILLDRIREFKMGNPHVVRGNFYRPGGDEDGFVKWQPNENGKFLTSYHFDHPDDSNQSMYEGGYRSPANTTKFIAGADPFRFNETEPGNTKSDGAGTVFRLFDSSVDDPDKRDEWVTKRFCCTYSNRPKSKKEYGEDMIMMCQYYGCLINTETNVPFIWDYFVERGYAGYLFRNVDKISGKYSKKPGTYAGKDVIEEIFREWQNYIEYDGMREFHTELLVQCNKIEEKMGKYDLFAAGGYALIAAKKPPPPAERPLDFGKMVESYRINPYR